MATKKAGGAKRLKVKPASRGEVMPRIAARPASVPLLAEPPPIVRPQRIHPRNLFPLVREGVERNIHSSTRDARLAAPAFAAATHGDELRLVVNTELAQPATNQTASNVGEPSCAINGQVVLYTGNWYAALSLDGGSTFQFMDPSTAFPDPSPTSRFCCDQVAHYIPQIDTFVWLLQYGPQGGDNLQRVAFARTAVEFS